MKRILLAAGLATLGTTAAMAQSSVTIYGRLNTTVERQKLGDVTNKGIFNNASRLGFKGTEDLGGGLKASFALEHRFNSDTGASTNGTAFWGGAGQAEVNLAGPFGMVRLGHFTSEAYYATADYVSLHNHDTGSSSDFFYAYNARDDDKVAYRTPVIGGFTLEASASARDGAGPSPTERGYDAAANYTAGPVQLGAGYSKLGDGKQAGVRALFEVGSFILGGYYQRSEDTDPNAIGGTRNNYRVSGAYLFGASEFHLNFGYADDYENISDSDAKQWTVAYNYNLSKRTKVYTYYTRVSDGAAGLYVGADKFSSVAVGIRHNF